MKRIIAALCVLSLLSACAHPSQNRYGFQDVGRATQVDYGRVVAVRQVEITGQNTGLGAAAGMTAGMYGGAHIGNGSGQLGALLAGAIIGAVAGAAAEQAMADRQGVEYVIAIRKGKTVTIVQNIAKDDEPIRKGARVMIQTSGQYQRVLPADEQPAKVKRAKEIELVD
jgi:outer membrane lipoprotein SlyB